MTLRGKMRKERGKQPKHAEHEEKAKSWRRNAKLPLSFQ